jgi:hypothetical protein
MSAKADGCPLEQFIINPEMLKRPLCWIVCLIFVALGWLAPGAHQPARAQTEAPTPAPTPTPTPFPGPTPTPLTDIPPSFRLLDAALGVQLYRKDYANGSPDFVQVIDLSQGARLELLHGQITEARPAKGSFGGPDPRMTSLPLETYWQRMRDEEPLAFCATNGTFFYMPEYPTRLAFPLKVQGQLITEGWGIDTYIGQKLILELWEGRANIRNLSEWALHTSDAPDILGGLTEDANKRARYAVGRTFLGLDDRDEDGEQETVLILNTQTALQSAAAAVLRDFGADQVMMLDGGGSTQLLCQSGWHIRSDRPIPQALAVIAAEPPAVSTQVLGGSEWPVLVQGEAFPFELEVLNTGVVTWTEQTTQLELDPGELGMPRWLAVEEPVQPGQRAVFRERLDALYQPGLHTVQIDWQIIHEDQEYPGQSLTAQAIVLPEALADQRAGLESALQGWKSESPEQIRRRVEAWLEEHSMEEEPGLEAPQSEPGAATAAEGEIRPLDAILVPLLMLPIVLILGFILSQKNKEH